MEKTAIKTERMMVRMNTGIVVIGAFFFVSAMFYTKTLAWGVIFAMGMAVYNLLQIKQLQNRPKIAAMLWLMPAIITLTTYPIPLIGQAQPEWLAKLALAQSAIVFLFSLAMFFVFIFGKTEETGRRKKRLLVTQVRVLIQTFIFILYLVVTAHSWLTGSKYEIFFWGAVNIVTTGILPFIFGRAICGWICPNATVQDSVYKNLNFKRPISKFASWITDQSKVGLQQQDDKGRKEAPFLPVTLLLSWFAMFLAETIFDMTPVYWYPMAFMFGLFVLSLIMPWRKMCAYFCWFSAYRCLASHNSLFRIRIDKSKCRQCKVCVAEKECPFFIDIKNVKDEMPATCCLCTNCMEACVSPGTIKLGFGFNERKIGQDVTE